MPKAPKTPKSRKSRAQPYIPPSALLYTNRNQHIQSPGRAYGIFAKLLYQKTGIKITRKDIRQTLRIPKRNQARIVASKQVYTCHNVPNSGPNPQG
jgi:hypothetical protein